MKVHSRFASSYTRIRLWSGRLLLSVNLPLPRPLTFIVFLLVSFRSGYAQASYDSGLGAMVGAGFITSGPKIVCGPTNQYAALGVYPRYGGQLYGVGVLEMWVDASQRCDTPISPSNGSNNTTEELRQPKMRGGLGVGLDRPLDEINLVFRVAGGLLGTREPWLSGTAGARYHRFFFQAELGAARSGWFVGDRRTRNTWERLSGFNIGFLF